MTVGQQPWSDVSALGAVEDAPSPEEASRALSEQEERVARDEQALRLVRRKATYRQVMAAMGYSNPRSAWQAVQRARAREEQLTSYERKLDQDEALNIALRRQVEVLSGPPPGVVDTPSELAARHERWVKAGAALVRIEERRAKLWGLDDPQRRIVEHHVVTPEALAEHRDRVRSELIEMGVDPGVLASADDVLAAMRAAAIDVPAQVNDGFALPEYEAPS